jgi:two-component system, cell cycle sensor histidine kinase and response regulator CckA
MMEINDRKSLEEHLRLQAAALDAAANGIVITGASGDIVWVNRAFSELTGYTREEVVGQNPRLLKSWEHGPAFYRELWTTIQSGKVWRGEIKNRKKDGSLYTEEMTITPVRSSAGEITHFIGIKQDVTENKRMEAQLRQAQKMDAVGRLAGGLAHDFNNLLSVIIGFSEISQSKLEPTHPVAQNLKQILTAADRAASLTRQLVAFSRQQVANPRIIDLNTVIQNLNVMLRPTLEDDISLVLKLATPLGSVKADVRHMEQVLVNLVVNARDAMPSGGRITIETRNVELDNEYRREHMPVQPGPYVMLSVADEGCGMDETVKSRLFEPFFTTKGLGKGSGLGLSTVYGIVKQNRGYIWVYSEPTTGTTFKVYFPRVDQVPDALPPICEKASPRGGSETILLVEDDQLLRRMLVATLQGAGYTVLEADTAEKALQLVQKESTIVNLLLTDVVLPKTSGIQLFELLRASKSQMKVVLMSGYAVDAVKRHGPIPPNTTFIEKPFNLGLILSQIRKVLDVSD